MNITKRDRSALKAYFAESAMPTEQNFAELIDAMLNQKDDGILKQPGSPLSLQASGDELSQKKVLHLYGSFNDPDPQWSLRLEPRSVPGDPATARRGLSIDSKETSRLFIDHDSGRVGLGTLEPAAQLHVSQGARIDGALFAGGDVGIRTSAPEATLHVVGNIKCEGEISADRIHISGPTEEWKSLDIQEGWTGNVWYFKDHSGMVHFSGEVRGGQGPIAFMPPGYAPEKSTIQLALTDGSSWDSTGVARVHFDANGRVTHGQNTRGYLRFDTVHYRAASR